MRRSVPIVLGDGPLTGVAAARAASMLARTARVPALHVDGEVIWDSLAICEYLAEQFQEKNMWPQDMVARALARSICAEMHSGFGELRSAIRGSQSISTQYKGLVTHLKCRTIFRPGLTVIVNTRGRDIGM